MADGNHRYFLLNKPYGMVSQFKSPHNVPLLGDLSFSFPEGTHAIGRLDKYSEGLLLLTTNKKITSLLFQGHVPHKRTYLVQVRHVVSAATLQQLSSGISIEVDGGGQYLTKPCSVTLADPMPHIYPPELPLHPGVKNSWLLITLTEGKYHQVRKMVAAAKHRCLRLIRLSIEDLSLGSLPPGAVAELGEEEFFEKLRLLP